MSFGNLYKIPFTATLTTNPCDVIGAAICERAALL